MRKDPRELLKVCTINPYLGLPQDDVWPFTRVTMHWGKGNIFILGTTDWL